MTSYVLAFVAIATIAGGCDGNRPVEALTTEIRTSLQDNLLAAWYPRSVDTVHGGFLSDFDADWNPVGEQDKMIVTQARHVWTTARAAEAFPDRRDEYLAISAQGARFLAEYMWDSENGGFHSLVTRAGEPIYGQGGAFTEDKTAYGNAFAIFGLAAYAEVSPRIVMPGKTWWAQAEAANTFLVFADLFPTDEHDYFARFAETWEYINQNLIDHERGGWYESDVDDPKASIWKGPYHAGRALMNIVERLDGADRMDDRAADLTLASLFTDGMVVQRGTPIPVIGTATPGATVRVGLAGRVAETQSDESGRWVATLPAMEAGGPYRLDVASSDASISLEDVMVGDVWVASGQSNMEWTMADVRDATAEAARATGGRIRHFKVPRSWSFAPEDGLAGGEWVKENPQSVAEFTAVGYFFARHLVEHEGVAIGLINTTWGGSRIEPWMSAEALGLGADEVQAIVDGESARAREIEDRLRDKVGAGWLPIEVPGLWEAQGFDGMDGVATYRTTFELTEAEAGASAGTGTGMGVRLGLGMIDDSDVTFVNDVEVGRMEWAWNQAREYDVPASALRVGENVVTVRVEDGGGGGGIYGDPKLLFVEPAGGARRALDAEWTLRVDEITVTADDAKNQIATMLYNKMVHPLQKYPIRGVIWYQGESNADPQGALEYADLFRGLITSWRREWGQGDFPFLWVQLANYMAPDSLPPESSSWAALRDAQTEALELPATGQALAIDIGETDDIHPRNKQDVGLRLALAARHVAYGDDEVVYSGPVYRSHRVEGGEIRVAFDHVGGGLVVGDGAAVGDGGQALAGFAIAGPDGRYFWADSRIDGDEVVVSSDSVAAPVAVRYAWGNNPIDANLYNREGLPATPFSRGQVEIRASPSAKSP